MPITEPVSEDAPLSQGDILKGVGLYSTQECWHPNGGTAVLANKQLCLVISRPCVAAHKGHVTVVAVEKFSNSIPGDVKTFEDVLSFLTDIRDGVESPDVFYLGEIPGKEGRFAARLDAFFDVQVPANADERLDFIRERRVARLHIDFARDLHVRIFRAFASLGFDDVGWLSDSDLAWFLEKGRVALAEATKTLHDTQAARSQKEFEGKAFSKSAIEEAEKKVGAIKEALDPYEAEKHRRDATA